MRPIIVGAFLVLVAMTARCQPPDGEAMQPASETAPRLPAVDTLIGAWNGQWAAENEAGRGSVEVVLSRAATPRAVLGHFTFLAGADSRTARLPGIVADGTVTFDLVGGGEIVLRRVDGHHLEGEFVDPRGVLPATRGSIRVTRVR
jgi:hypothetical protein